MTKDEALMLAMEAMEITGGFDVEINAIKEALAQPEQEPVPMEQWPVPVFWYRPYSDGSYEGPIHNDRIEKVRRVSGSWVPLHTTPPQSGPVIDKSAAVRIATSLGWEPKRKPLTSKQIREWWASENGFEDCDMTKLDDFTQVVRGVEGKHGIKE